MSNARWQLICHCINQEIIICIILLITSSLKTELNPFNAELLENEKWKHICIVCHFLSFWYQGPLLLTWINFNPNMDK